MKVALAVGGTPWESQMFAMLRHPASGMHVVRRCVDGVDAREAAVAGDIEAVIVSDDTLRMDVDLISHIQAAGVAVIAVTTTPAHWAPMGCTHVVDLDRDRIPSAVAALAKLTRGRSVVVPHPVALAPMVVVSGFAGGVGRSTTARDLAFSLANPATGQHIVLADADAENPSLALLLGVQINSAPINTAQISKVQINAVPTGGESRASDAPPMATYLSRGIALAPKAISPRDAAFAQASCVVVDLGRIAVPSADKPVDAVSRMFIGAADVIVLCTRADSASIATFIRGFAQSASNFDDAQVIAAVNGTTSRHQARQVSTAITRHTGVNAVHCIPAEQAAYIKASERHDSAISHSKAVASAFAKLAQQVSSALPVADQIPALAAPPSLSTSSAQGIAAVDRYLSGAA